MPGHRVFGRKWPNSGKEDYYGSSSLAASFNPRLKVAEAVTFAAGCGRHIPSGQDTAGGVHPSMKVLSSPLSPLPHLLARKISNGSATSYEDLSNCTQHGGNNRRGRRQRHDPQHPRPTDAAHLEILQNLKSLRASGEREEGWGYQASVRIFGGLHCSSMVGKSVGTNDNQEWEVKKRGGIRYCNALLNPRAFSILADHLRCIHVCQFPEVQELADGRDRNQAWADFLHNAFLPWLFLHHHHALVPIPSYARCLPVFNLPKKERDRERGGGQGLADGRDRNHAWADFLHRSIAFHVSRKEKHEMLCSTWMSPWSSSPLNLSTEPRTTFGRLL
ncbi:hypothetical protein BDK51DRAFT_32340 [Blyttiomyces helicus]|uniref:Uncharacterized protein n=1 Tax=Blyttiomyces helicus TaxID=388810 RepID=A0A4P9W063_9FUNG|nr:hypothetical protein BDK51DRAFT_32340 [Blyttiomyces helicus]|eukprot:RKO85511.1 hypothetical protein BDK51DRAFT_32340 [Blyttiomyces helicus]